MRKFDDQVAPGLDSPEAAGGAPLLRLVTPAVRLAPPAEGLRALVGFAISRGYYQAWNKSSEGSVRRCSSTDFPTDRVFESG
jgi:hypothetical protein